MATELNKEGDAYAETLIDAGKVDSDTAWSMSAADENALLGKDGADWDNYSKFHLGIKPGEAERTKAYYAYPHGKGGKVYRRALIAAEQRATAQGDDAIAAAAKRLLERVDAKSSDAGTDAGESTADAAPAAADAAPDAATASRARGAFRDMSHVAARIFGTPLLIAPQKLAVIMGVLGPRLGAMEDDEASGRSLSDIARERARESRAAVRLSLGMDDDDGSDDDEGYICTADGMAIVPVDGTLVYKSSWLAALSGMTSYGDLGVSLAAALADPKVKGILLAIDSYGGEVNGCFDLADQVMSARAQKPLFAVAADNAFSAAYAIAAAADKFFVSRTSGAGSIGTVALHVDQSGADKMEGLKYTYIHSGDRKVDGNPHEPLSSPAKDSMQAECDRMRAIFVQSVARYRGLSADDLTATEAQCYFGNTAVAAKLADAVGTPMDALAALRAEVASRVAKASASVGIGAAVTPAAASVGAEVVDLAAVRGAGAAEATTRAVGIIELCKVAGQPALAGDFITRGLSEDAVRQALQTKRAEASAAYGVANHITLGAGLNDQAQTNALWDKVLVKGGYVKPAK